MHDLDHIAAALNGHAGTLRRLSDNALSTAEQLEKGHKNDIAKLMRAHLGELGFIVLGVDDARTLHKMADDVTEFESSHESNEWAFMLERVKNAFRAVGKPL